MEGAVNNQDTNGITDELPLLSLSAVPHMEGAEGAVNNQDTNGITENPTDNRELNSTNGKGVEPRPNIPHGVPNAHIIPNVEGQADNHGRGDVVVVPPVNIEDDSADQWKALAAFFGILIGTSIPIFVGMQDQQVKKGEKHILSVGDILHSKRLDVFVGLVILTITFTGAYYSAVASIWPMIKKRPFWFQGPAFVTICSFYLLYVYKSKEKVPKFSFGTEFHSIPSFWLLWLCSFSLIIAGIVIYGMGSVAITRIRAAYRQN